MFKKEQKILLRHITVFVCALSLFQMMYHYVWYLWLLQYQKTSLQHAIGNATAFLENHHDNITSDDYLSVALTCLALTKAGSPVADTLFNTMMSKSTTERNSRACQYFLLICLRYKTSSVCYNKISSSVHITVDLQSKQNKTKSAGGEYFIQPPPPTPLGRRMRERKKSHHNTTKS